jgi:hypothetical protein
MLEPKANAFRLIITFSFWPFWWKGGAIQREGSKQTPQEAHHQCLPQNFKTENKTDSKQMQCTAVNSLKGRERFKFGKTGGRYESRAHAEKYRNAMRQVHGLVRVKLLGFGRLEILQAENSRMRPPQRAHPTEPAMHRDKHNTGNRNLDDRQTFEQVSVRNHCDATGNTRHTIRNSQCPQRYPHPPPHNGNTAVGKSARQPPESKRVKCES